MRKTVHIIGSGIGGSTLACTLDPKKYKVVMFDRMEKVIEASYGVAVGVAMFDILSNELELDLSNIFRASGTFTRPLHKEFEMKPRKGKKLTLRNMQRVQLLKKLHTKAKTAHGDNVINSSHSFISCKILPSSGKIESTFINTKTNKIVTTVADLIVGADGRTSKVRNYVSLEKNQINFGNIEAFRLTVEEPSKELFELLKDHTTFSIGRGSHSPAYFMNYHSGGINFIVLHYKQHPTPENLWGRSVEKQEIVDMARRTGMTWTANVLEKETSCSNMKAFDTYHVDAIPWQNSHDQGNIAIIGDAAHGYGPLTGRMCNLAINDAFTLGTCLNNSCNIETNRYDVKSALGKFEEIQRPKFNMVRAQTYRHLEKYMPNNTEEFLNSFLKEGGPMEGMQELGKIMGYRISKL